MEIRCKKEDCKHNTGCSCNAHYLEIMRGTQCNEYVPDPLKNTLIQQNGNIFAVAEDLAPTHLQSVPLECFAKSCIYNKECSCNASGITVADDDHCADCATYCEC